MLMQVFGLKPHEQFTHMTCKVFAECFLRTLKAPPDVEDGAYIGNLAVLVRLFYVWLIYNYTGHLIYNVAEIQHRSS